MFAEINVDEIIKWLMLIGTGILAVAGFIKDHFQHQSNVARIEKLEKEP